MADDKISALPTETVAATTDEIVFNKDAATTPVTSTITKNDFLDTFETTSIRNSTDSTTRNNILSTQFNWNIAGNQKLVITSLLSQFSTEIRPASDSTYDFGTNTIRWANGYFDTLYGDGSNLTGISGTDVTTKGDLQTYDSAGARLPVGTNGQVLTADSGETTGLKWAAAATTDTALITFSVNGALFTGTGKDEMVVPKAMTITSVIATVGGQATGASVITDINKLELSGTTYGAATTIFTTQGNRPTIAVSTNKSSTTAPDVTAVAAGDKLQLDLDQIGSTLSGQDLRVAIYGTWD